MEIITLTPENIVSEHICCAISDKKGECQVSSKKSWLKERFADGLVFKKADVRGKVFIEYMPAEKAWCPIAAENYMFINCFWVSGQYQGQGMANILLNECIEDSKAKGKIGLVILTSPKKMAFLSDPKYLKYKGFKLADEANPYFNLVYLPFVDNAPIPQFKACAKEGKIREQGFVLYYSNQCPFTAKYVSLIAEIAKEADLLFKAVKYGTMAEAQNAPSPFTTYSMFYNGQFLTNEILSEKKFHKTLQSLGLE